MRNIYFILFFIVSNLSHSYENNQLLLNNQEKKINITPLETLDGNIVNLSDITTQKKIYLLNFWATWCPPCIKEIPHLIELENKFKDDIKVIYISVDNNPKKVIPKFKKKYKFPDILIISDRHLKFSENNDIRIMPTTLIMNKELIEIGRVEGYIDWLDKPVILEIKKLL
ncbi:MAG: TlpA family protein disulfide reductase [Alphaproteobacteria bacterium]